MPDNYSCHWRYKGKQNRLYPTLWSLYSSGSRRRILKCIFNVSSDNMCSEEIMEDKDTDFWPIERVIRNVLFKMMIFKQKPRKNFKYSYKYLSNWTPRSVKTRCKPEGRNA